MPIQSHQNDIPDLPNLTKYVMENLFPVHKSDDNQYFYNIIRTVSAPETLSNDRCYSYRVAAPTPLTNLSHHIYGRMELWWLICVINKIDNPVQLIPAGTVLKIIKTSHIDEILNRIRRSIV